MPSYYKSSQYGTFYAKRMKRLANRLIEACIVYSLLAFSVLLGILMIISMYDFFRHFSLFMLIPLALITIISLITFWY